MAIFKSKKLETLRNENEDLKNKLHFISEKKENARYLEELLIKLRKEVVQLNKDKTSFQEAINSFKAEKEEKLLQISELQRRINGLNEINDELNNTIVSYPGHTNNFEPITESSDTSNEISLSDDNKNNSAEIEHYIQDLNQRIKDLTEQESELQKTIDIHNDELIHLDEQKNELLSKQSGIKSELSVSEANIISYEEKISQQQQEINEKNKQIAEYSTKLDSIRFEYETVINNLTELHEKENNAKTRLEKIIAEEKEKSESIKESSAFFHELEVKKKLFNDLQESIENLKKENSLKEKALFDIEQTLSLKSNRLSKIDLELLSLENKSGELKEEAKQYELLKNDIQQKYSQEREIIEKLSEQKNKLQEIVPLLIKRKKEIEDNNNESEERFTKMFQKFNHEFNEINKKRNILEKILLKKETDLDEKDQQLFEKIAFLEESQKVLNIRQAELESIEMTLDRLSEQKSNLKDELIKLDQDSIEKKSFNSDLRSETELLLKKKIVLEKSLQELLRIYNESFIKIDRKKEKQFNELKQYEDTLQQYRNNIDQAIKDLEQLQSKIGSIRIEHEEYKGSLSKMVNMKKRLHDEILKQQTTLQKYQKVREKLKIENLIDPNKISGGSYQNEPPKAVDQKILNQKDLQIFKL